MEKILVKIGDKVSEGTPILMFKGGDGAMTQPPSLVTQQEPPPQPQPVAVANTNPPPSQAAPRPTGGGRHDGSGRRLRHTSTPAPACAGWRASWASI